jgi:2-amino-4-hydroxy-6-hydroxymethyldihydropteridine diphosphokinase
MVESAVVALGSNMGDRAHFLAAAVNLLAKSGGIEIEACSSIYETPPLDVPTEQGDYLNQVITVRTELPATELLTRCQEVERLLGRPAEHGIGMPRVIDLDLIIYGSKVYEGPLLRLPHPRYSKRKFVLVPLAEVMPTFRDPITGETIADILASCPDTSETRLWNEYQEQPC